MRPFPFAPPSLSPLSLTLTLTLTLAHPRTRLCFDAEREVVIGHDRRIGMEGVINIWVDKARPQCVQVMLFKGSEQTGLVQRMASIIESGGQEVTETYEVVAPLGVEQDAARSHLVWQVAKEMCDALRQVHRRFITDTSAVEHISADTVSAFKSEFVQQPPAAATAVPEALAAPEAATPAATGPQAASPTAEEDSML